MAAQGAGHHARLQGGGCAHAGQFALGCARRLVGHGGQQDGAVQRLAQQGVARVRGAQIGQWLGQQAQRIQGLAVVGQGVVLIGSALNVPPGCGLDVLEGLAFVIGRLAICCRNLAGRRFARRWPKASSGPRIRLRDHMRSRLW